MSAVAWTLSPTNVAIVGTEVSKSGGTDAVPNAFVTGADPVVGNGSLEFTADTLTGADATISLGLTPLGQTLWDQLDFSWRLFAAGGWEIRENGTYITDASFVVGDVFKITITGTTIEYFINGVSKRVTTASPAFPLYPHVLFWNIGAAIRDADITGIAATDAAYNALIASDAPAFVVLVEPQPMEPLRVWTAAGGGLTNTYYCSFTTQIATTVVAGGLYRRLDDVRQNATALTSRASAALVDANLGSYFHDVAASRIYVSTTSGASPETFALVGAWFTLFLSTTSVSFTDQPLFSPLVTGSLPTLSAEMPDTLFGAMVSAAGTVSFLNGDGLFDRLSRQYVWRNKRVTLKLGGQSLGYSDFATIDTVRINRLDVDDEVATLQLEDAGTILNQSLPLRTWGDGTIANGPGPEMATDGVGGLSQPLIFGTVNNAPLALGGRTIGVADYWYAFDFNSGPYGSVAFLAIYAVHRTTRAWSTLTSGSDYTTSGATVTMTNSAYFYETHDLTAKLFNHGTATTPQFGTMAQAILEICGESLANIDTAAFTAANVAAPQVLSGYLGAPVQAVDVMRVLEQSCLAQVYRGSDGRWTCRVIDQSLPAAFTLVDADFAAWHPTGDLTTVLDTARIRYAYDPHGDDWAEVSASDDAVRYGSETSDSHRVDTWLTSTTDATALAQHLRFLRSVPAAKIHFEERGLSLMSAHVGDLVAVTRSRAPVARTGAYTGHLLRIVKLDKALGPEIPTVRGVLSDLDGQTDHIARCLGAAEDLNWSAATTEQRTLYGFCGDANRYIDPADPATKDLKVVW